MWVSIGTHRCPVSTFGVGCVVLVWVSNVGVNVYWAVIVSVSSTSGVSLSSSQCCCRCSVGSAVSMSSRQCCIGVQ